MAADGVVELEVLADHRDAIVGPRSGLVPTLVDVALTASISVVNSELRVAPFEQRLYFLLLVEVYEVALVLHSL